MRESAVDERRRSAIPFVPRVPRDAVATALVAAAAWPLLVVPGTDAIALRAIVGVPLLFFLPGYALLSCLFPRGEATATARVDWAERTDPLATFRRRGLGWRERVALSFGVSLVLPGPVAVALSVAGLTLSTAVVAATLVGWTVGWTVLGAIRRYRVAPNRRFAVPRVGVGALLDRDGPSRTTVDVALDVGLAALIVLALAGTGYAALAPNNAESFASVTILSPTGDGDLVANGYPETLAGDDRELVVRVANHEGTETAYTVVAAVETVRPGSDGGAAASTDVVGRASEAVAAGGTWKWRHELPRRPVTRPTRVTYYLYRGDAPETPDRSSAHRHASFWVQE